jgi:hypothetical protein
MIITTTRSTLGNKNYFFRGGTSRRRARLYRRSRRNELRGRTRINSRKLKTTLRTKPGISFIRKTTVGTSNRHLITPQED